MSLDHLYKLQKEMGLNFLLVLLPFGRQKILNVQRFVLHMTWYLNTN